jgi:hypothetical protein
VKKVKVEVRNDKVIIDGYVNAVDRFSKVLYDKKGQFIEKILPSVFRRALEKNPSVKVLLDHDYDKELANTKDGSAELYEDNIGLRAIVEITDADVIEKAKKNKLRGWSFGFSCNKEDEVINKNGMRERSVRDINLFEVSIIDDKKIPAYIGTSIELRDGETTIIEYRSEEFDDNSFSYEENKNEKPNFSDMTASQKRDVLNGAYRKLFNYGWLDDYDDEFVYGTIQEDGQLYKMPYSITDGAINIDSNNQVKVVRGGYKEIRAEEDEPEHPPSVEVEKIDYSKYENILNEVKGGNKR